MCCGGRPPLPLKAEREAWGAAPTRERSAVIDWYARPVSLLGLRVETRVKVVFWRSPGGAPCVIKRDIGDFAGINNKHSILSVPRRVEHRGSGRDCRDRTRRGVVVSARGGRWRARRWCARAACAGEACVCARCVRVMSLLRVLRAVRLAAARKRGRVGDGRGLMARSKRAREEPVSRVEEMFGLSVRRSDVDSKMVSELSNNKLVKITDLLRNWGADSMRARSDI